MISTSRARDVISPGTMSVGESHLYRQSRSCRGPVITVCVCVAGHRIWARSSCYILAPKVAL